MSDRGPVGPCRATAEVSVEPGCGTPGTPVGSGLRSDGLSREVGERIAVTRLKGCVRREQNIRIHCIQAELMFRLS